MVGQKERFKLTNEDKALIKDLQEKLQEQQRQIEKLQQQIERNVSITNETIRYMYYKSLHPDQYAENLKEWFYEKTGEPLNLDAPVTYNEKIQWLKLHDSTPEKTRLADKYLVRDYVREKIGEQYLIPLLGVYDRFDDIDFEQLPNRFAMKCNHGSGWNIIVSDKTSFDREGARKKFNEWMSKNYAYQYGLEIHYKNIDPKILIEQYMENDKNELMDYRFFCFSGEVRSIWVDVDSGKPTHRRNIYDLNWNLLPLKVNYPNDPALDRKPENLSEMLDLVQKLSEGFKHVRVDLYEIQGKIYFGEMTFTSQSGVGSWDPKEYNKIMGDYLSLS